MAENSNGNGVYVDEEEEEEEIKLKQKKQRLKETLPEVLNRIASAILFQEPADAGSLLRRIKVSVADNATLLPEASRNSARDVLIWTRRGTPFRALFVISVRIKLIIQSSYISSILLIGSRFLAVYESFRSSKAFIDCAF